MLNYLNSILTSVKCKIIFVSSLTSFNKFKLLHRIAKYNVIALKDQLYKVNWIYL